MFHMWDWGFGIGNILMLFFSFFVIAVIVVVIVIAVTINKQSQGNSTVVKAKHDKAVEEARERYAKGKINREEYKQIMEDLKE